MNRFLFVALSTLFFSQIPVADAAPRVMVQDNFTVKEGNRPSGSSLNGQKVEDGAVAWKAAGNLILAPQGWITASDTGGSVGMVPLSRFSGKLTMQADIRPSGSGFVALAFMTQGNSNFWGDNPLWVTLWPTGKCELRAGDETLFSVDSANGFKKDDFNHLELIYDSRADRVTVKLNRNVIAKESRLPKKLEIGFAAVRFQEPLTPDSPALDNFSVTDDSAPASKDSSEPEASLPPVPASPPTPPAPVVEVPAPKPAPAEVVSAPAVPAPVTPAPVSNPAPGASLPLEAAAAGTTVIIEDTFTVNEGVRMSNSGLANQVVEKGDVSWKSLGNLIVVPEGWVTASGTGGSVGIVPLPAIAGTVAIQADLNTARSGFLALAFMEKGDVNFWNDTPLWMNLWANGRCEVRAGKEVVFTSDQVPGFKKGEFNRTELIYDSVGNTVCLKLNGVQVLDPAPLVAKPVIGFAGFRFQEPVAPNIPALDNFRVSMLGAAPVAGAKTTVAAPAPLPPLKTTKPLPELMGKPFWESDVVTDEPLLFVDSGQGPTAKLLFPPEEIISVRSASQEKEFKASDEFQVTPGSNIITVKTGSTIPSLKEEDLYPPAQSKKSIKAARGPRAEKLGGERWLRSSEEVSTYFSNQVVVTYRRKKSWDGYKPVEETQKLSRSLEKLKTKKPFKVLVLGDSISAGCFASSNLKSPPFQPNYPRLVMEGLKAASGADVTLVNLSKGGQVANYGLTQVPAIIAEKPDLVVLAFGMNDGSGRIPADKYGATITKTMELVRQGLPEVDFVLVSTILGNPDWTASAPELYPAYRESLKKLEGPGVAVADMTAMSEAILKEKAYADITINGVNHPNDFAHRVYAEIILGLLGANPK